MPVPPPDTRPAAPPPFAFDPEAVVVMGILNVTPDSFSDGGRFEATALALAHARAMAAAGAGLIDVGGESTRPGHAPVSAEAEMARVLPVLEALERDGPAVPVSIDTTKAPVARAALARGARLVNDQWGLQGDPAMAEVVAEAGAGLVAMHNRDAIDPALGMEGELIGFFERTLRAAERAGIGRERIALDPGIGFGKTPAQQLEALAAVPALRAAFGLPVLVGVSRKSLLGRITGAPVGERLPETLAANVLAFRAGARLFRVHDVPEHVAALKVAAALERAVAA